jgi:hypothetical protein
MSPNARRRLELLARPVPLLLFVFADDEAMVVDLPDVLVGLTVVALEFLTGFATAPLDRVARAMVY